MLQCFYTIIFCLLSIYYWTPLLKSVNCSRVFYLKLSFYDNINIIAVIIEILIWAAYLKRSVVKSKLNSSS